MNQPGAKTPGMWGELRRVKKEWKYRAPGPVAGKNGELYKKSDRRKNKHGKKKPAKGEIKLETAAAPQKTFPINQGAVVQKTI